LTKEEHAALSNLAKDESIVITKADKGNAVVIQNKKDYQEKVNGHRLKIVKI
jgi:UDP-N-acetylglucosamine transferase subunit ALG13